MARRQGYTFTMNPIARAGLAGLPRLDEDPGLGSNAYAGRLGAIVSQVLDDGSTISYDDGQFADAAWPNTAGGALSAVDVIKMAKDLGITWLAYDQQKMVQEVNLARVQRGLSPISMSSIAPAVNFGLTSETMTYLMIGGVALLLVVMMGGRKH